MYISTAVIHIRAGPDLYQQIYTAIQAVHSLRVISSVLSV